MKEFSGISKTEEVPVIELFADNPEPEFPEPELPDPDLPEPENKPEIYDFESSDGGRLTDNDDATFETKTKTRTRKSKTLKIETFSCDVCGKVLSSKGNLKKHKVVHLSEKPWQCKECQMSFNQARDLNSHIMQKHSEERPHVCKVKLSNKNLNILK